MLITAGVGAGLAIGWAVWPRRGGLAWTAGPGEHVINAFVKIGSDGRVTVAVPQAEMGQGIWSGLAQIVADEMGADWRAVGVEPAPLGPDYANHGMIADATRAMPAALRGAAGWAGARIVEYFDFQITGGSTSIRGFEAPLRLAGAAAREMLCRAAARRWEVDWRECEASGGFVTYKANRLAFGDLAAAVRPDDAPDTPQLRDRPPVGRAAPRLDIPAKTDGSARFGIDVRLPEMLYAAIEQGPIGATTRKVDRSRLPAAARLVEGPGFTAVVADGWWAAKSALDTLRITYTLPANAAGPWQEAGLRAALATDAKDETAEAAAVGDPGIAAEKGSITADYALPFLAHACLEPMTATARFEAGRCEVWCPTQSASLARWSVARALDLPVDAVTIYPTLLGGGFGRKVESDAVVQAAIIARAVGRPVQLIWSREEDFGHDFWRPAAAARMVGTADAAGIKGWDARIAVPDVGAGFAARNLPAMGGSPKAGAAAIEGAAELPYAISNFRTVHAMADCAVPLGFWRSVGHSFTGFMVECFVDELAEAAGADPGAFRLAMLKDKPRHAAVLRAALAAGGPLGPAGPGAGRGVALVESFGSIVAQVAEVALDRDGRPRVTHVWAAVDCGRVINPDSVRAQIEGGIAYGLTAALHGAVTFTGGHSEQRNFDTYPLLTMAEAPRIEVVLLVSTADPGGIGEPGTPPIAPAVANAIFAAGGGRRRSLPLGGRAEAGIVPAAAPAPAALVPA
jgi:isoquinoline 1-oxidoreductase beta subunit